MEELYGFGALLIAVGCFGGMRAFLSDTGWDVRRTYVWLAMAAIVLVLLRGESIDQRITIVALSAILGGLAGTIFARSRSKLRPPR